MQISKFTYADLNKIQHLQPKGWPDIIADFKSYINDAFCNPIKLSTNGCIFGLGNSIIFRKSAWISHIIVDENYRNLGFGTEIMNFLLLEVRSNQVDTILLIATEMGEPIYKKAGFRIVSDYVYLKKERNCLDNDIQGNIQPYKPEYYDQIIKLDIAISGEYREPLIRKNLANSLVYLDKKAVKGIYFLTFGEGAVYADNPDIGIEMMKLKYKTINKAVIPSENRHGINFLLQNGFVKEETFGKRMILGEDVKWKPDCIFSRIGGNYG